MEEKRPFVEWLRCRSEQDRQRYEADRYKWLKFAAKWKEDDQWVRDFSESDPGSIVQNAITKLLFSSQANREVEHDHFTRLVFKSIDWGKKNVLYEVMKRKRVIVTDPLDEIEDRHGHKYIQESHPSSLETLLSKEDHDLLDRFKNSLGDFELVKILDLILQDGTQTEIARKLGCSNATISRRVEKLHNLMREFARREGFKDEQSKP